MRKTLVTAVFLLMLALAPAITVETASLRGFLFGSAPGAQYQNWISHLAEGIARTGYNNYAPWDVQSNSFGDFHIPEPADTLAWNSMLDLFIACEYDSAQAVLAEAGFPFQIVEFHDTDSGRTYYMIRELPDFSFIDTNNTTATYDDEFGAFQYGWGLFIYNPAGTKPAIISVPHPCDDFPSPILAYQALVVWNARYFMINGAGREVRWTNSGIYDNSKSLSDPTRNANHPFHKAYVKFADAIRNSTGKREFSPQIHTYDWGSAHAGFSNCQISAGNPGDYPNLPIRDMSALKHDLINRGDHLMVPANSVGTHTDVYLNSFYAVNYDETQSEFIYSDGEHSYPVNNSIDLPAYSQNKQMLYSQAGTNDYDVFEPFFHIEMDELPNVYGTSESAYKWFYGWNDEAQVWDMANLFSNFVNYYGRWIEDLEPVLVEMFQMNDGVPPSDPVNLTVLNQASTSVDLGWECSTAYDFDSYEVLYASTHIGTDNYLILDRETLSILATQVCDSISVAGLTPGSPYYFRIRARDKNGLYSALSNEVAVNSPTPDPLFAVTPTVRDFGIVVAGTPASQVFTISNDGDGVLDISSAALAGYGSSQFVLQDSNSYPVGLEYGENMVVTVLFQPTTEGSFSAQLEITDNQSRVIHRVNLSAVCTDAPNHGGGDLSTVAGGYYFANNLSITAPSTPHYAWISQTANAVASTPTGGNLDNGYWGPFAIGFNFEYYGTIYSEVYFSTNGYIQFGGGSNKTNNATIPANAPPDNLIALFWDDLQYYTGTSNIHYGGTGSAFVITYDCFGRSGTAYDPSQSVTAQIILYSNGNILLQYQQVTGNIHTPTIGIENSSGDKGIQYHHNGAGGLFSLAEGGGIAVMFGPNEETLPVELSAFTATQNNQNMIQLTWVTQSETGLRGFYVLRNSSPHFPAAQVISPLIAATNTAQMQCYIFMDTELYLPGIYWYWLEILDLDGNSAFHEPLEVDYTGEGNSPPAPVPAYTELLDAWPNPFNPSTTINYTLKKAASVRIDIFNLKGQILRSFHSSHHAPGVYQVLWDGRDSSGNQSSSGIYFYRMSCGRYVSSKKMILAK